MSKLQERHPELVDVLDQAERDRELQIFVNNSEIPPAHAPLYYLHDGDTVSLLVRK